jgi:hypothetical protein
MKTCEGERALRARYFALVSTYWAGGRPTPENRFRYMRERASMLAELGEETMGRLSDDYDVRFSAECERIEGVKEEARRA